MPKSKSKSKSGKALGLEGKEEREGETDGEGEAFIPGGMNNANLDHRAALSQGEEGFSVCVFKVTILITWILIF